VRLNNMSRGLSNLGCSEQPEEKTTSLLSLRQVQMLVCRIYITELRKVSKPCIKRKAYNLL
jgi:hypothetical protein